jgi:predicted sugar kinase
MPLNTDYRNIKNYKRKLYRTIKEGEFGYKEDEVQYKIKPRIETIIFATMITGIPNITEKNYEQFYNRLHLVETIHGSFFFRTLRGKAVADPIRKEEIEAMIGLKSNASTLTLKQFLKRFDKDKL